MSSAPSDIRPGAATVARMALTAQAPAPGRPWPMPAGFLHKYKARAHYVGTGGPQSLTNANPTGIWFDTQDYNPNANLVLKTVSGPPQGIYTCPLKGYYLVIASIVCTGLSAVTVTGTTGSSVPSSVAGLISGTTGFVMDVLSCNQGDQIGLGATQTSGGPQVPSSASLTVIYLGSDG